MMLLAISRIDTHNALNATMRRNIATNSSEFVLNFGVRPMPNQIVKINKFSDKRKYQGRLQDED